jgi:hypothetical protein
MLAASPGTDPSALSSRMGDAACVGAAPGVVGAGVAVIGRDSANTVSVGTGGSDRAGVIAAGILGASESGKDAVDTVCIAASCADVFLS